MTSGSDTDLSVGDNTEKVPTKGGKIKKKKCKSLKPSKPCIDVLTVLSIADRAKLIKSDLCTKLSKSVSDFSKMTPKQISDCGPLKKIHLAEHLLSLIAVCDIMSSSSIQLSTPIESEVENSIDFSSIEATMNDHMKQLNTSNNFAFETIQDQVKRLEKLMSESVQDHSTPPTPSLDSHHHHPIAQLSIDPHIDLIPDFSDSHSQSELCDYLGTQSSKFNTEGERSVTYFGEHDYRYSGKVHEATEPPASIGNVMALINQQFPNKKVNSCLVTRYVDGNEHCPPHHDDEDEIAPESYIYTLSLGADRHMVFERPSDPDSNKTSLLLPHGSLLVFSRLSQCVYKHSIPCDPSISTTRYSLTFRYIAPGYKNSTIILGDSNAQGLKFGESKDSFGQWMPGKVMKCMKVEQIPPPAEIGPYKNIVIHTGVNNVKFNESSVPATIRLLEEKCKAITDVFPSSNVYICPLLPTKDPKKNSIVYTMNNGIVDLSKKHPKILLMSNYWDMFADQQDLLKRELGKFERGRPSTSDDLHLGSNGIKLLATCIKHCVLKRRGTIEQYIEKSGDYFKSSSGANMGYNQSYNRVDRSPSVSGDYARAARNRMYD